MRLHYTKRMSILITTLTRQISVCLSSRRTVSIAATGEVFWNVVLERYVTARQCQRLHLVVTLPRHEIVPGSTRAGVQRRNLCDQPYLSGETMHSTYA